MLYLIENKRLTAETVVFHTQNTRNKWITAAEIPAFKKSFDEKIRQKEQVKEEKRQLVERKREEVKLIEAETVSVTNEVLTSFAPDGQDPTITLKLYEKVKNLLTPNEKLYYLAHQKAPHIITPDCFALTEKRVIHFKASLLGSFSFVDFHWLWLANAHMSEGMVWANVFLTSTNGAIMKLEYVPKPQARAIYRLCQQCEETALAQRRTRWMEDQKAMHPSQSIVVNAGPAAVMAPADDPVAKLQKFKQMLDAGLISQADYDAAKAKALGI